MTIFVSGNRDSANGGGARHDQSLEESSENDRTKRFTGLKLDFLKCVMFDRDIKPWAYEVAACILNHVNAKTMRAMLSDETIAEETGNSERTVRRARKLLRQAGWLDWNRTRTANVYKPLLEKMNPMLDAIQIKRDARHERRQSRLRQRLAD